MKPRLRKLSTMIIATAAVSALPPDSSAEPPVTDKKPISDEYHGVKVVDDYRWLEDASDPAVKQWCVDQNRYSRA